MKFIYEFRTSDNVKHTGVICALDREAAYAELKKQGIRPCRFAEAPGLFNKVFGKGKRWIAIAVLSLMLVASLLSLLSMRTMVRGAVDAFDSTTRRQVIGDVAIIDEGIRTGWAKVFDAPGDRFLASYAVPGAVPAMVDVDEREIARVLSRNVAVTSEDSIEVRQIKAMLIGIKDELREFLSDGGTILQYCKRLSRRQQDEIRYYQRAKSMVDRAVQNGVGPKELRRIVEEHNESLRRIGVQVIVLPSMPEVL